MIESVDSRWWLEDTPSHLEWKLKYVGATWTQEEAEEKVTKQDL
jgi:hypothetical protein